MSRHEEQPTPPEETPPPVGGRRRWPVVVAAIGVLAAVLSLAGLQAEAATKAGTRLSAQGSDLAPAAGAGHAQAQPAAAKSHSVMIMDYKYSPAALTVAVGDTVTWTNMDTAPHTVTVTDGPVKFDSGNMAKGDTYTYTFTAAGTYDYYCAVHPDMVAKVTVTGGGTEPTPSPSVSAPPSTPPGSPSPTPSMSHSPPPGGSACVGLNAAVEAFLKHFYAGHLEPSLSQQISDILSVDQYVKTHTVLIENMIKPLVGGSDQALKAFLQHVYAAHLEASPTQQVSDILALDQYVKTHTVMIENMIKPLAGSDVSSC